MGKGNIAKSRKRQDKTKQGKKLKRKETTRKHTEIQIIQVEQYQRFGFSHAVLYDASASTASASAGSVQRSFLGEVLRKEEDFKRVWLCFFGAFLFIDFLLVLDGFTVEIDG